MSSDQTANFHFKENDFSLKLKVTLAADKMAVDGVVRRIMEMIRENNCIGGKEQAVELALSEALANAVMHGAKSDPSKIVECDLACDDKQGVLIIVRDPGEGFDPAALENPIRGQNIYKNGGRGIYLINELMDEVRFLKNGTEIHMIKR